MTTGPQPDLTTERLVLRPLAPRDAADIQRLAGTVEVSSTVLHIPHPYPDGLAEVFVAAQSRAWNEALEGAWAITRDGALLGCIALHFLAPAHRRAGIGYWIGREFWGHGYATEAARAVIAWAFAHGWKRVQADHLVGNDRSGRVMQKAGMHHEGTLRAYYQKGHVFYDVVQYAIVRDG